MSTAALDARSAAQAYDDAYQGALRFFDAHKGEALHYRGVHWLRCLRKPVVDQAYPSLLKTATEGGSPELPPERLPEPKAVFGPARLQMNTGSNTRILFFADPNKVWPVLSHITPRSRVAFYSNSAAPKLAMRSLAAGAGFVQRAFGSGDAAAYRKRADQLIEAAAQAWGEKTLFSRLAGRSALALLPKILFDIDCAFDFFKQSPVKAVLMDEDATTSRNAFAQAARLCGVKTFVLCHGVMGHPNAFVPLEADYFLAWGEAQKQKMAGWGADASRVLVSGCTRYESYRSLDAAAERRRLAARYGFDAKKSVGVLAPPLFVPGRYAWEEKMLATIDAMFNAAGNVPGIQWVVKLHPGDPRREAYEKRVLRGDLAGRARVEAEADPYPLIVGSDLVLAYYSTFAVDAFAMGRPVVLMRDAYKDIYEEYRPYGVFIDAISASDATDAIQRVLSGRTGADQAAARRACLNEGGPEASSAIAALLKEAAEGGRG